MDGGVELRFRSPSGRYHDWGAIVATLRSHPGVWIIHLPNEPARLQRTVRERSHPALHLDDGVVEARLLHRYVDALGQVKGDVHLRFVPHERETP